MNTCKRLRAVSMPIASAMPAESLRVTACPAAVQQVVEQPQADHQQHSNQQAEVGRVADLPAEQADVRQVLQAAEAAQPRQVAEQVEQRQAPGPGADGQVVAGQGAGSTGPGRWQSPG